MKSKRRVRLGIRMTQAQIKRLRPGDEVFWTDPDGGKCSRTYHIRTIEILGEVIRITDYDGSSLECFARELS